MSARKTGGGPPGSIRIISGTHRGRRLKVPRTDIRPTGERVREAIFDALGPVGGLSALDLFAGTGAMGLEALSRGAAGCVFVERDPEAVSALRSNIEALGLGAASTVLVGDYVAIAGRLAHGGKPFDLLFVDPPYRILPEVEVRLEPLLSGLVAEDGVVVVEGPKAAQAAFSREPVFDRVYGDTRVVMISMRRNDP